MEYSTSMMPAEEVLRLVTLFDDHRLEVILDGGWAVDALLGEQTRQHSDLDLALPHKYVPDLRALLNMRGYKDVPRDDTRDCNFVLGDDKGHLVDIHTFTYDEQGNLVFGLPYPLDSLTGHGSILGYTVRCITPEWLVQFHTGYALDENDIRDVSALCRYYKIALPPEFERIIRDG